MNLSNRLTFSLIFSVVLVALFALAATPALAITEVTAQLTEVVAAVVDDTNTDDDETVQGKKVVTIKYSENADPAPTLDDFTSGTGTLEEAVTATAETNTLSVALAGSGKTFTLTFLGEADGSTTPVVPAVKLPGYAELTTLDAATAATTTTPFVLEVNTLAGKGYAIIATYHAKLDNGSTGARITATVSGETAIDVSGAAGGSFPTLPTQISSGEDIVRRDWDNHFDAVNDGDLMPDLWAHFQQGHRGTLDLTVVQGDGAPIDGAFDSTATDATTRDGDVNARTVVINEVMWGRDNSAVGGLGYTREQWIEIYNTKTTPVAFENIWFTLSNDNPAPADASTDRLSTNPSFTNVWNITSKGQDGHPGAADGSGRVEFIAMHRTGHGANSGANADNWAAAGALFLPNYKGTPGMANSFSTLPEARPNPEKNPVSPNTNAFIINEIGNVATGDWVEIINKSSDEQKLNGWSLSLITDFNDESDIYNFPNKTIPAGGIVLLVRDDPQRTPFARGFDLSKANLMKAIDGGDQDFGADPNITYLKVGTALNIPDNNDWLLVLRSNADNKFHNSSHHLRDVAGPARIAKQHINEASPEKDKKGDGNPGGSIWQTTLFPMNGRTDKADATLSTNRNLSANVWARDTGKHGFAKQAFNAAPFTGIGYDRNVPDNAAHGGTPGYPNNAAKSKAADISGDADNLTSLVISELMLTTDNGRYPQWIELRNISTTNGIRLNDPDGGGALKPWQIRIENHNSGTWSSNARPLNVNINLSDWFNYIPPNQSVLIAAFTGSYSDNIPGERVADVTMSKRGAFKMSGRRDAFLNAEGGFLIQIVDSSGAVVDAVGNLDGEAYDARAGIGLDDPFGWNWPTAMTEGDERTSLIRLMNKDGTPRAGTPVRAVAAVEDDPETEDVDESADAIEADEARGAVIPIGEDNPKRRAKFAWVHAADLDFVDVPTTQKTWFGSSSDKGTPLHTAGKPLPVNLSFFRPTLEDGKVVIRWTTESELDNAGFNILRSDTRNGEFKQVNDKLIQGKGTTAERSTYKWVDTSAKPGAVYYYQIEDVSFAGERNMLTTTKLKGLISAKNKLTTTWSELKSQN